MISKSNLGLLLACVLGLGMAALLLAAGFSGAVYGRTPTVVKEEGPSLELLNQIGGSVLAVAQQGNYAYISVGPRLTVVDVSDPANPVFVGESDVLPGVATHIEVSGSYVYAAVFGNMLVLDVSNPTNPTQVGSFEPDGFVTRFVISGSLAYVGERTGSAGGGGLRLVDISNPASPSQVSYLGPIASTVDVALDGIYAYIALDNGRIKVIDVSNPANPMEVGEKDTQGYTKGLATDGDFLYVAMANEGLWVYNLATPTNPSFEGNLDTFGDAQAVDYNGDIVYLAEGFVGLTYIDVSNPGLPVSLGTYQYPVLGHYITHVYYGGGHVYAANNTVGLRILDPAGPTEVGFYEDPLSGPTGMMVDNNLGFISDYGKGLRLMDMTNGTNPVELGVFPIPSNYYETVIEGSLGYFANSAGLRILDISNTSMPTQTGALNPASNSLLEIELSGSYAYMVSFQTGLYVIDVSNPVSPTEAANYDTPGISRDLAMTGNYVYVTDSSQDLAILDVSDPLSPTLAATFPLTGTGYQVKVEGQYAYATAVGTGGGLYVLDISDPVNPAQVGYVPMGWYEAYELEVVNGYAYISATPVNYLDDNILVFDVSDPTMPELFGGYLTPGIPSAIDVRGAEIYVPTFNGGLYIFRGPAAVLADNDSPTVLGSATNFTATTFVTDTFSFNWDFGDGNNGSGQTASHTYGVVGEYTAVLVATGVTQTYTATTSVLVEELIAGLTADNDGPTALGSPTTFSASTSAGSNVVYSWDFGDGVFGTGAAPNHTYATPGVYTATVTASNAVGTDSAETVVIVEEAISGLAASNDGPTPLGEATTLMATITAGTNVSFTWDYGDGTTGSGPTVMHTYGTEGMYTAVVTATNLVSGDTAMTTVVVEVTEFKIYLPAVVGKP